MDKEFSPAPLDDQDLRRALRGGAARRAAAGSRVSRAASGAGGCGPAKVCGAPDRHGAVRYFGCSLGSCRAIWRLAGGGGPGHGRGGRGGHRCQPAGCRVGHHQRLFPNRKPQRAYRHRA